MRMDGRSLHIKDRTARMRYTSIGGLANSCNHWGGRGILNFPLPHNDLYIPYVWCQEEAVYIRRLGDFIHSLEERTLSHLNFDLSVNLVVFRWPYDKIWFTENYQYFCNDIDFKFRLRLHNDYSHVFLYFITPRSSLCPAVVSLVYWFMVPTGVTPCNPYVYCKFSRRLC